MLALSPPSLWSCSEQRRQTWCDTDGCENCFVCYMVVLRGTKIKCLFMCCAGGHYESSLSQRCSLRPWVWGICILWNYQLETLRLWNRRCLFHTKKCLCSILLHSSLLNHEINLQVFFKLEIFFRLRWVLGFQGVKNGVEECLSQH